ncbi:MAG: hypothetical protein HY425_02190 [Candidatus Levybacteria bacterium]|nr:hypothetical protein [Candidatus Levybacteria bacterium]
MIERESVILVVGCGEKGAAWTAKQKHERAIGLDFKMPKGQHGELILGDVFNLPIGNETVSRIRADFIVNGLTDRKIAASQIFDNPDVLATNDFPPLVREWFVESMKRSHDSVRKNIKEVSALLKTTAMREMWRVLENKGCLEILDFEYNINWINHYAPQIVAENPMFLRLEPLIVTPEDYERSSSLQKVVKGSARVQKIALTKSRPPIGSKLPLADFSGVRL